MHAHTALFYVHIYIPGLRLWPCLAARSICVYVCVCMYVCVYVCVCVCICVCVWVCVCVCECVHGRGCHSSVETIVQVNMMSLSDEGACMTEQISEYQISCLRACSRLGTCLQCQRFRRSVSLGHAICKQASELCAYAAHLCACVRERARDRDGK